MDTRTQAATRSVTWSDLSAAEKVDLYPQIVQASFGMGATPNAFVTEHLMPPMLRLQAAQLEITTWCNLACQQCGRTKLTAEGKWRNLHMPLDRYQRIIAKLPPTQQIFLQGIGEPSMHPHFVELVASAAAAGKFGSIHFNTNAHTHDDAYWTDLGKVPNVVVAVSVDSLDPEIAERCRANTKVDLLWSRLQLFRHVFPHFNVALVASRLNLNDLEATLRKIAGGIGAPIAITKVMSDDAAVLLTPEDEAWVAETVAVVRRDHKSVPIYFNQHFSGAGAKRCISPFVSPFITVEGYLTPCCAMVEPDAWQWVRVDDERSWDEIRTDPRVTGWVEGFIDADPLACQGCTLNPNRLADGTHVASRTRFEATSSAPP